MNRPKMICLAIAFALGLGGWLAPRAAAQGISVISGQVFDEEGKPFADLTIVLKNTDVGQTYEVKTDRNGKFSRAGVATGIYLISVKFKGQVVWEMNARVTSGTETPVTINFKELKSKQQTEALEALKKQEEERQKFEGMKGHFDTGVAALAEARQVRGELSRAPADQRAAIQQKVAELSGTAINELQEAGKGLAESDPNQHVLLARLGESYELAGRYDEAAAAYQKAVALKPDSAGYYNNLGNVLAKQGKIQEAGEAYQKSASLDPPNAAAAWRNFGIVLFNAGRAQDAVEPLKKSLEIDPKSAQGWYVLGAALVGSMGVKQEGGKLIPILQPGTIEAYEKCIELDPNGPYGTQAQQGLEQLKAMGVGIETKVKTRTKK